MVTQSSAELSNTRICNEEEWAQLGDRELSRSEFALYRIVPTPSWTQAEFLLEDEQGTRIGSFLSQSRLRADLNLREKSCQMYIQRSGAFASEWSGKVGGTSDRSIVIRNSESVLLELFPLRKFPAWSYQFVADGRRFLTSGGGWLRTKPFSIFEASVQVGIYRRPRITSRKILLGLRNDLPDSALLAIMVAALLQ